MKHSGWDWSILLVGFTRRFSLPKILRIPDKRMVLIKIPKRPSFWERLAKAPIAVKILRWHSRRMFRYPVLFIKITKAAGMITEEFGALKMEIPVVY